MKLSFNEFYLKLTILVLGTIYWVYGCMTLTDTVFDAVYLCCLFVIGICCFNGHFDSFNLILFTFITYTAIGTLLFSSSKKVTMILLLYICIEVVMLPYCSKSKTEKKLKKELQIVSAFFLSLSFIIISISAITYFFHISYIYSNSIISGNMFLGIDESTGALVGVFTNANAFSSLLVQNIAFVLYLTQGKWYRFLGWGYSILLFWMVVQTKSRGGLIGAVIVLGFYMFTLIKKIRQQLTGRQAFFLYILAGMTLLIALYLSGIRVETFVGRDSAEMGRSTSTRLTLWKAGLEALFDNPLHFIIGFGGNIKDVISKYIDPSYPEKLYSNMHNIYMQTFMVFGLLGLIYLLIALFRYVISSFNMMLNDLRCNCDMNPLIGLMFALLVISCVESDLYLGKTFLSTMLWIVGGYVYRIEMIRKANN